MFSVPEFDPEEAQKMQLLLSKRVICEDCLPDVIRLVAGIDATYTDKYSIGAVAVLDYETMKPIEKETSRHLTKVPYIPAFLSFRELPPVVSAIKKLRKPPSRGSLATSMVAMASKPTPTQLPK